MARKPDLPAHLKARIHALKPIIRVGQNGITPALINELEQALEHHQLLKIKVAAADRDQRASMIDSLCQQTSAICVQRIGHTAVLYRPADRHSDA